MDGIKEGRAHPEGTPDIRFELGIREDRKLREEGMVVCFSQNNDLVTDGENIRVNGQSGVYEVHVDTVVDHQDDPYHPKPNSGIDFQIRFLRKL